MMELSCRTFGRRFHEGVVGRTMQVAIEYVARILSAVEFAVS